MASGSTVVNLNGGESASLNGEPVLKRPRENGSQLSTLRAPKEPHNKVTVVLGAQWGDEGKGKVVDLLAMDADIVCRCQVRHDVGGFNVTFSNRHSVLIPPLHVCVCMCMRARARADPAALRDATLTSKIWRTSRM